MYSRSCCFFFRIEVDRVSFYHFFFPILFWFIFLLIQSIDSTSFLSVARALYAVRPYNCSLCCCGYCTSSTAFSVCLSTCLSASFHRLHRRRSFSLSIWWNWSIRMLWKTLYLVVFYTKVWCVVCVLPFFVLSSFYNAQVQAAHQTHFIE